MSPASQGWLQNIKQTIIPHCYWSTGEYAIHTQTTQSWPSGCVSTGHIVFMALFSLWDQSTEALLQAVHTSTLPVQMSGLSLLWKNSNRRLCLNFFQTTSVIAHSLCQAAEALSPSTMSLEPFNFFFMMQGFKEVPGIVSGGLAFPLAFKNFDNRLL